MKKIYFTLAGIALSGAIIGQTMPAGQVIPTGKTTLLNKKYHLITKPASTDRSVSTWVSYAEAMNQNSGGSSETNFNMLLNDTLARVAYDDGNGGLTYGAPWIHSLGQVFDARSQYIASNYNLTVNSAYTVDSMRLTGIYQRVPGSTAVDTLLVTLFTNNVTANMPLNGFVGMTADYNSDTVWFKTQKYTYTTNKPNASGAITKKILLTEADTAIFDDVNNTITNIEKAFQTNGLNNLPYAVPNGRLLGVGVTYKPGMAYTVNDTLLKQVNSYRFASYEENGDQTFPTYTYCPNSSVNTSACDWNVSSVVPSDVRYNVDTNWAGMYIPTYAYTVGFAYEHHRFDYHIITPSPTVGINEMSDNGLTLSQNMPNPAKGNTVINYEIAKSAKVVIEVTDVTGKKVMTLAKGVQSPGKYSVEFDSNQLEAGVYFYTLKADNAQVTKRMSIIK